MYGTIIVYKEGGLLNMREVIIEVKFTLPDIHFTEDEQKYFNELVQETLEKRGKIGLLIALESYLGK
jgi:hypothetical protein